MPLIRSLTSGSSSLKAHQQRLDVISNNIANVNTTGFKASRATFSDQFSQTFNLGNAPSNIAAGGIGGIDPLQIGLGVKLGAVKVNFMQGAIQTTNRPLDLALQGEGYFVLRYNGQERYTRAGSFSFDTDGNLVDGATGAYVQGYNLETDSQGRVLKDSSGNNRLNRTVTNVQVPPTFKSAPRQTQSVSVSGNLNAGSATGDSFNTSITIFDNQGGTHQLNLRFSKSATVNQFDLQATIDNSATPIAGVPATITFNDDGTLNTPLDFTMTAADLNTALATSAPFDATTPKNVVVTLADSGNVLGGLTQFAGQNTATVREQDGYGSGELSQIAVDQAGRLVGSFTNGQSELLGQVVIGKFTNPGGLVRNGNSFFSVSPNSGLPNLGTAVEIFPSSSISSGSLEESNVDLTEEFTDLISTQRAFEAASRTVTISDQFLQEINQLKR
ncbi:flagellar hook protein FlgE [Ignavibacteria bacterium]|nr:flagellar hook protein FlgE [Bacteroidota bacterium]MCZ2132429.1 flagellar hook protein FlgE [Bacteroidota bacterium]